jgi:hypothetical protein
MNVIRDTASRVKQRNKKKEAGGDKEEGKDEADRATPSG